MRNNQPVTQKEYVLPEGFVLVSHTDLHGNITYANEAFVEASGYSYEELMSQPHNLLRHPDVPEQVFADFLPTFGRRLRKGVRGVRLSKTVARTVTTTGLRPTPRLFWKKARLSAT